MTFLPPIDPGELYRVLAASATDAIVTIDEDSVILSINPAGERLFGYAAADLVGHSLSGLMPERYKARHQAGMARYLATNERHISWRAVAVPILNREGREVPVEISFGEFVSQGRRIFSAIVRDVSDRVAAEAALAAGADQLEGQAMELEQQVEEAQTVAEELEQANELLHATNLALDSAARSTRQLQRLTSLLAAARTLDDVASVMIDEAVEATGAATGMLAVRDGDTGDAVMIDEEGLPGPLKADYLRFPLTRDSPTAECIRTNAPIFVGQRDGSTGLIARYPALRNVWDTVGRSAVASIPIRIEGMAAAAMSFTFADPQPFDREQQEFFVTLAAQAAQAIERVRAFEAERAERRRSESIVEAITDGFVSFDHELRFTYVNTRAASMFGVPRGELVGSTVTALPQSTESPFVSLLHQVMATKAPAELEAYGTITGRWLSMRAYPAEDGGVIAYFQDVTEQRRRRDASSFLAEASRLLASSRDYETTLQRVARAAIPRLGDWCAVDLVESVDPSEVPHLRRVALVHDDPTKVALAEQYRRLYPPDLRDGRSSGSARALAGESILVREVTEEMLVAGAKDEKQLVMLRALGLGSIMIVPLPVAGQVLGTLTFCTGSASRKYDDVDRYLAEDLASRAANAIEHARLLERAEAANAAKAEFLRTISHELRQPLNAMGGLLQLWELGLRGALTSAQQEDLARIKRNQHQLSTLIEDLLSFAKLEAGKLEVKHEAIALAPALEGLTAALGVDFDARGVIYRSVAPPPSLCAIGDADRLHQVLVNLVTNAMKATSTGDLVEVTCAEVAGRVELRVRDTGTGIAADHLQSIFTPFVQVGRALNQPLAGAGLGLAISRGLVEAMGGTLTVQSVVGEGSTFTVSLERAPLP